MRQSRWAALLLLVAAASCTGGFTSGSLPDSIDRTLAGLPVLTTEATETGALPGRVDVNAAATVDAASGRYRVTVRFPKLPAPGDPGAHAIELPRRYEVVVDGGTVYVRAPSLRSRFETSKPWLKADADVADPIAVQLLLTRWAAYDPVAIVQLLRGVSGDLMEVGDETIERTTTTRFRGTVDLSKAEAAAPPDVAARVRATGGQLAARFGAASFPVDLWVDGDGLIHRIRFGVGAEGGTSGRTLAGATFTVDLSAADPAPTVDVPAPERAADVTHAAG